MGVLQDNLVLSTGLIMWIGHRKEIRKLTFWAWALRRSESSLSNCPGIVLLKLIYHVAKNIFKYLLCSPLELRERKGKQSMWKAFSEREMPTRVKKEALISIRIIVWTENECLIYSCMNMRLRSTGIQFVQCVSTTSLGNGSLSNRVQRHSREPNDLTMTEAIVYS